MNIQEMAKLVLEMEAGEQAAEAAGDVQGFGYGVPSAPQMPVNRPGIPSSGVPSFRSYAAQYGSKLAVCKGCHGG